TAHDWSLRFDHRAGCRDVANADLSALIIVVKDALPDERLALSAASLRDSCLYFRPHAHRAAALRRVSLRMCGRLVRNGADADGREGKVAGVPAAASGTA